MPCKRPGSTAQRLALIKENKKSKITRKHPFDQESNQEKKEEKKKTCSRPRK